MKRDCNTCEYKEGSCFPSTLIFDKDKTCKSYVPDYEGYITDLEKENEELKKRNGELAGQKASLERWFGEAKEIIKDLLSLKASVSSAEDVRKRFSVRERAEKFLKESEE